jgi:hypothetical protein
MQFYSASCHSTSLRSKYSQHPVLKHPQSTFLNIMYTNEKVQWVNWRRATFCLYTAAVVVSCVYNSHYLWLQRAKSSQIKAIRYTFEEYATFTSRYAAVYLRTSRPRVGVVPRTTLAQYHRPLYQLQIFNYQSRLILGIKRRPDCCILISSITPMPTLTSVVNAGAGSNLKVTGRLQWNSGHYGIISQFN